MTVLPHLLSCAILALVTLPVDAATIDYAITSDAVDHARPSVHGDAKATVEIDGPAFRIRRSGGLESSDDDGATTWFGADRANTQSPLAPPTAVAMATAPIVGRVQDETLVVGPSAPGPERFGLPTRVYTIDYRWTIGGRVLAVPLRPVRSRARYTMTVVDIGVSPAAVRVLLSRGYNHALSQHAEAFTGLPVHLEGAIDSDDAHVRFTLDAETLAR